jgi:excisionase family DNA binding protein
MTQQYVLEVETAERDVAVAERWVDELAAWHGAVAAGPIGNLVTIITLPAEDLAQACATGLAIVGRLAPPVSVVAQPETQRDEREGWGRVPDLLSVAEAGARLGVSRQRVLQMIDEGKLPATRVGKVHAVPASAIQRAEV